MIIVDHSGEQLKEKTTQITFQESKCQITFAIQKWQTW